MQLSTLESLSKIFCYNISNADKELRHSKYNSQSTSLEDIQEMVHNNFGDLDDEDQEEEVIDLTTELVQLEREESLERSEDTVEINANEMYHLELDKIRDNLVNNENEELLSEDSESDDDDDDNWGPVDTIDIVE